MSDDYVSAEEARRLREAAEMAGSVTFSTRRLVTAECGLREIEAAADLMTASPRLARTVEHLHARLAEVRAELSAWQRDCHEARVRAEMAEADAAVLREEAEQHVILRDALNDERGVTAERAWLAERRLAEVEAERDHWQSEAQSLQGAFFGVEYDMHRVQEFDKIKAERDKLRHLREIVAEAHEDCEQYRNWLANPSRVGRCHVCDLLHEEAADRAAGGEE